MSKRILFFGNETLATGVSTKAPIFNGLLEAGYKIEALIISSVKSESADQQAVVKAARQHNIPVLNIVNLKQSVELIKQLGVDTAVLAAYGKIVPQSVLDLFKIGIINIHPSLLPKHRGPTPIESAILKGDLETGVTIIKLSSRMDSGPVYTQQALNLSESDSKQQIADSLAILGRDLLLENLEDIIGGLNSPKPQPENGATYDKLITKADGVINWNLPAKTIVNQIRAYANWPKSTTQLAAIDIVVTKASRLDTRGNPGQVFINGNLLGIYAGEGAVILEKVIPAGKQEMTGDSFLVGYKQRLNY